MDDRQLGLVLGAVEREDWAEAWTQLEKAIAEQPNDYELLCAAGPILTRLGRRHQAHSHLLRAIERDPDQTTAYLHLGDALAAEGQWERSVNYYTLAWVASPDEPTALNRLMTLYADHGLPYAAKQAARKSLQVRSRQPQVRLTLRELEGLFPDRDVTVYVPAYNAAKWIEQVLEAVFLQSYPFGEVLVIDDGSTDNTVELASKFPVRIITHGTNRGLAQARNTALLVAESEYLANLDADVVADRHWLERLMLHFESERLCAEQGTDTGLPLAGVMGRLDELNDVMLPDQWRSVHMGQHHGDERQDEVPHIYGCNGVYRRERLMAVGGYDVAYRTNGEDCDLAERVRAQGTRLAYDPDARCRHLRTDSLKSVLDTMWRYRTPYPENRFGVFRSGSVAAVMQMLPLDLAFYREEMSKDEARRSYHLLYPSFLGLPWRILRDFGLAVTQSPAESQAVLGQTQTAIYLGVFALLGGVGAKDDLVAMIHEDLAPCRPADPELAAFCSWDNVQATLRSGADPQAHNPAHDLVLADRGAVNQVLRALGEEIFSITETSWSMIRSSAYRVRDELAYRATLAPDAIKVAVLNCPWSEDGRIGVRAGSRWPFTQQVDGARIPCYVPFPFFQATAAAMLKRDGFDTMIVDAIAEGLTHDEFLRRVEGFGPQVVLMESSAASHELDHDWALRFKELLGDDIQVIFCGPHATAVSDELLPEAPQIDAIILGEYEPVMLQLMRALRDGGDLTELNQLVWREEDGTIHAQTKRDKLQPINTFPWPERDTLPMYNYFDSITGQWPHVQMHASRGCPFTCIFCVWPQVVYAGQNYRTRDSADLVEEMAYVVDRYGFKSIYFDDDTFNIGNERILDLCDRIVKRGINVPIEAMGRADTSTREVFEAMHRAGLVAIKFGVETGDPEMMQRIKKHLDLGKVRQAVRWCKELGIGVHLTFSFGGPGETLESAALTLDLACELDPTTVQFSLMTPFPGTVMYETAVAEGRLLTRDWTHFDGARFTVVEHDQMTRDELENLMQVAHRRWLLNVAERSATQPLGLDRGALGRATVEASAVRGLAPGSLDLLQLTTGVEQLNDLRGTLDCALAALRPGGLLTVARAADACQAESRLAEWSNAAGLEAKSRIIGTYGAIGYALHKPAAVAQVSETNEELCALTV